MSAAVCLAAMIPARRAVSRGSPFFVPRERTCFSAPADIVMRPRAIASRAVAGLAETSTIRSLPVPSMWESTGRRLAILVTLYEEERQAFERHREVHALELDPLWHLVGARREIQD